MEPSRKAADGAVSTEPTSRSKEKRSSLPFHTLLERLLLAVGLVLLAVYVGAKIHGVVLSRVAVQQFEELKRVPQSSDSSGESAVPNNDEPRTMLQPELASWSRERIKGYQRSLDQHLNAPLAVLHIPKIRLEVPLLEGTDDLTLNRGVGRIGGTAHLGEGGNIGIAGHRDGFFRGLKELKIGDTIELEGPVGTETYVVDQLKIVDPSDVSVLQPRSRSSLTLVTCYPFYYIGSAPKRYIVHAARTDSGQQKNNTTEQGSLTPAN
jgi:sortase A